MKDMLRLLRFAKPYRRQALFALAMLAAMVALDLSIPLLVQRIIDLGVRRGDLGVVLRTSALMLGVSFASMLAAVLNSNSSIRAGEGVARDLRDSLFARILAFSQGDMDRYSTGELMVRLSSDAAAVQRLVQVSLRIGTRAPLSMAGSVALMFATSPALACSMVPLLAIGGALIVFFGYRMEPLFREAQGRLDRLNTVLQENIAGARLVKAFVREGHEARRFGAANDELAERTIAVMGYMSSMTPALTLLINAGLALVVWIGGARAVEGGMTLGQMVAFANYLLATMHPLVMMTQLSNTWASGLASARRVNEVLEAAPRLPGPERPRALADDGPGSVAFRGVGFRYDAGSAAPVLEGIGIEARPGETVAILGATGSGKTSLVGLVPRFYDAEAGRVLVDGVDVREADRAALLSRIAIVPQDTILFSGSVRDNIRFGRPGADDAEVEAAARAAEAHDFILRLPKGYETRVEERGVNLSGGQKQRIAIARALLARPAILILDDATSAVDVETETRIQASLAAFGRRATTIVVAQRISTVLNADRIVLLDEGRIAAEGSHAELLASSPLYREIYDSQLGGGSRG